MIGTREIKKEPEGAQYRGTGIGKGFAVGRLYFLPDAHTGQWQTAHGTPEEELALLVDFCQCELFGQVTNWLNQNMVYDIVAHVQALCRLFEGSIAQALEAAPMEA